MFDPEESDTNNIPDYLLPQERRILDSRIAGSFTFSPFHNEVIDEILVTEDLKPGTDPLSDERRKLGSLTVSMIQKMDDRFDDSRDEFKGEAGLSQDQELLGKLMSVETDMAGEKVTIGELLAIINKAAVNQKLYPNPKSRELIANDIQNLATTVVHTVADIEKEPESVGFDKALELRHITNEGESALMFDLGYGDLIDSPGYGKARQRILDMAVATSLNDDFTDFIEDMEEERVNSFLAAARETGEFAPLVSFFGSEDFKKQAEAGEVEFVETAKAKELAPKAYAMLQTAQSKLIESVNSDIFTTVYGLRPLENKSYLRS